MLTFSFTLSYQYLIWVNAYMDYVYLAKLGSELYTQYREISRFATNKSRKTVHDVICQLLN